MEKDTLTARQKGDIYWRKRKRFLAAAAVRSGVRDGYLTPDMAAEVLDRYEELKKTDERMLLSGNEFSERPPTAVGRRAFSDSVAIVMHERDRYKRVLSGELAQSERAGDILVRTGMEAALKLTTRVIEDYFAASGMTESGEKIDREARRAAGAAFKESVNEYEKHVKENTRQLGIDYIEKLRNDSGLKERMEVKDPGAGPVITMLKEQNPEAALANKETVDRLINANVSSRKEAAELLSGMAALRDVVIKTYYREDLDKWRKDLLIRAFMDYSLSTQERIRELLYKQEASAACAAWLLAGIPADELLSSYIDPEWGCKVSYWDGMMKLSEQEAFVSPLDHETKPDCGELAGLPSLRKADEEIKAYLFAHPWQFDAQCLVTICRATEALPRCLANARAIRDAADRLTEAGYMDKLDQEERAEFYEIWVRSDTVCRVGYTVTEFVDMYADSTVREATEELRKMIPFMSYFATERECRSQIQRLIAERMEGYVQE